MTPDEHNGDQFHYIVTYRRRQRGAESHRVKVTDWRQAEFPVDGAGVYQEYEVSVQAANRRGFAPTATVERTIGYSGQDGKPSL